MNPLCLFCVLPVKMKGLYMTQNRHSDKYKKNKVPPEEDQQKWLDRENFQDLAKIGGDILKKTVATGRDVIKEVKENFPKEATQLLNKGKEEILKGLSQDVAKNILSFGIETFFAVARQHRIEFSIRFRKNENESHKEEQKKSRKREI